MLSARLLAAGVGERTSVRLGQRRESLGSQWIVGHVRVGVQGQPAVRPRDVVAGGAGLESERGEGGSTRSHRGHLLRNLP